MKQEEKNRLSRQRILAAAMQEFSENGYESASLNTICAKHSISKGILYHYFKDKKELYLLCVKECFDALTSYLKETAETLSGAPEQKLRCYFNARLLFFAKNPLYQGIFTDAALTPPSSLHSEIAACRNGFDTLNLSILTELLNGQALRKGLSVSVIVEDFKLYMDFFNTHFTLMSEGEKTAKELLSQHEELCRRQLEILLYGVLEKN